MACAPPEPNNLRATSPQPTELAPERDAGAVTRVPQYGSISAKSPRTPLDHSCTDREAARTVASVLREAGLDLEVGTEGERGVEVTIDLGDEETAEIAVGCLKPDGVYHLCMGSETDYVIAASTVWIEQAAATARAVLEILRLLEPTIGSVHCFGTDQIDIDERWEASPDEVRVQLNPQHECMNRGGFALEGDTTPRFRVGHGAVEPGTKIHWMSLEDDEAEVLDTVIIDEHTRAIEPVGPECASLRLEREPDE